MKSDDGRKSEEALTQSWRRRPFRRRESPSDQARVCIGATPRARSDRAGAARRSQHAEVIAFLADGESWSSSALALALGTSARTVQRALDSLAIAGKVQSSGRGRARRWMTAPVPGFTTTLLLPGPLPSD
jgi:hypothetical protein